MEIGFIGCGNMAKAMISGILAKGTFQKNEIIASGPTKEKMDGVSQEFGIKTTLDNIEAAKDSRILVLSVKPQMYDKVIREIRDDVSKDQLVVTIAAGLSMESVERSFGKETKIIRTMPNTPALVGEGMTGMCMNPYVKEEEACEVTKIFESFGRVEIVDEKLIDAVVGVSGSSPAYVYMFIEALADAAVLGGIPREKAYTFAAQAVLGSAKMVLETKEHPGKLKDAVCSPAGTTIEAVRILEEKGLRSAVIEAANAAVEVSKKMG